MKTDFIIRAAQHSEIIELRDLYKNTVLQVNRWIKIHPDEKG